MFHCILDMKYNVPTKSEKVVFIFNGIPLWVKNMG